MATTPTEWYTSLPGVGSVGAPADRRSPGGGGGGRVSPLMSEFQKRRRELQNLLAEQQLELMKEKLKQARESHLQQRKSMEQKINQEREATLQQREARLLAPWREGKRSPGETLRDKIANEQLKKLREEAANRAAVVQGIGPNALGNVGAYKAGRVQARSLYTGGPTGRTSINPYGDPGIAATPGLPEKRAGQAEGVSGAEGDPEYVPSWLQGKTRRPFDYSQVFNRALLPGREKGGTIPKTGPYELHEGEIVVSADQVDRPLMAALKADKLSKMRSGQMDGKGTGRGVPTSKSMVKDEFRGGTLHSYQAGSIEEDARMREEALMQRMMELSTARESAGGPGQAPAHQPGFVPWQRSFAEGGMEDFPGAAEGSVLDRIMAYLRADPRGNPQFMERPAGSPEDTSALLEEAIGEASPARPYPHPSFEESSDQYKEDYMRNVAPAGAAGARPMRNYAAGGVDPEAQVMDELLAMGDDPRYQQQERDRLGAAANQATFERAAAGDRGLGEAGPLTLERGGPLPEELRGEQTWTEKMADPKERQADRDRLMATLNEQKADRLQNYLMRNAGDMDPQTFKAIQDQANQLKAINKNERDRQTLKDESSLDRIVEMKKAYSDYQGQLARAQATGKASQNVGLRQEERDLRGKLERYEFKFLEDAESGVSREVLERMAESMFDIEAQLEGIGPGDSGYQEARDAYMNYQMSVLGE